MLVSWRSLRQRNDRTFAAELIAIFPLPVHRSNQRIVVQVSRGARVLRDQQEPVTSAERVTTDHGVLLVHHHDLVSALKPLPQWLVRRNGLGSGIQSRRAIARRNNRREHKPGRHPIVMSEFP